MEDTGKEWDRNEWQGRSKENVTYSAKVVEWTIKIFFVTLILYWISRFF